jgi:hypothetical protein
MEIAMGLPAVVDEGLVWDPGDLGRAITLLAGQINAANYRLLKLIAEFDLSGGWKCGGAMRTCAHWLVANCGIDLGAAREKVRVARRLAGLPEVEGAFASGDLSYSKVRAITRVATSENEGLLVALADKVTANHLEKLVSRYQPVPDVELPPEAEEADVPSGEGNEESAREHAREMFWFQDENGMWVIHARLPPEQGHLVVKALEAVTRPLQEERQEEYQAARDARVRAAARAIAERHREAGVLPAGDGSLADEAVTRATSPTPSSVEYERAEEKISAETFAQFMNQVRADAFAGMVEHFLAMAPDYRDLQGLKGAERCQVVLHVDVNTLREQRSGACCAHGHAYFEDKPWISAETARRLSCDASLVTVLEDEQGQVLNVGRRSRVVPSHIRRALMERDGVCQFPGCSESRYVDAHHIVHWAEGGETSLDNLVTLCRFHHARLHQGCFDIEVEKISAETSGEGDTFSFVTNRSEG